MAVFSLCCFLLHLPFSLWCGGVVSLLFFADDHYVCSLSSILRRRGSSVAGLLCSAARAHGDANDSELTSGNSMSLRTNRNQIDVSVANADKLFLLSFCSSWRDDDLDNVLDLCLFRIKSFYVIDRAADSVVLRFFRKILEFHCVTDAKTFEQRIILNILMNSKNSGPTFPANRDPPGNDDGTAAHALLQCCACSAQLLSHIHPHEAFRSLPSSASRSVLVRLACYNLSRFNVRIRISQLLWEVGFSNISGCTHPARTASTP